MARKHLPADQRRSVTVEAVIDLAGSQNPSEITTSAIAERMKLTQGAVFRHFPTKDALWQAAMEWVVNRLLARLDHAARDVSSSLDAMQAMFMAHVEFVAQHPGVPRMIFGELQRTDMTPAKRTVQVLLKQYRERLERLIERAKAEGRVAAELDTNAAITLFIGMVQGLVMQSLLSGDADLVRREAAGLFAIYRQGIARTA